MSEAEIVRLGSDNPSWRTVGTLPCYPIWRCLWRTSILMIPNSWMVSWMTMDDLEVPWQNGKFHDDYIYREREIAGLNRGCLWGYFHRLFIGPYMEVPHRLTSTGVLWRRGQKCWWLFCGRRLAMQLGLKKLRFPPIYDHLWIVMVIYLYIILKWIFLFRSGWNRNSVRQTVIDHEIVASRRRMKDGRPGWSWGAMHSWRRGKSEKSTGQRYWIQSFLIMFPFFGHEEIVFFHIFVWKKHKKTIYCLMIPPVTQVEHGLLAEGALDDWGGRTALSCGFAALCGYSSRQFCQSNIQTWESFHRPS